MSILLENYNTWTSVYLVSVYGFESLLVVIDTCGIFHFCFVFCFVFFTLRNYYLRLNFSRILSSLSNHNWRCILTCLIFVNSWCGPIMSYHSFFYKCTALVNLVILKECIFFFHEFSPGCRFLYDFLDWYYLGHKLDFRRSSLVSDLHLSRDEERSVDSFPEQRLVIKSTNDLISSCDKRFLYTICCF